MGARTQARGPKDKKSRHEGLNIKTMGARTQAQGLKDKNNRCEDPGTRA